MPEEPFWLYGAIKNLKQPFFYKKSFLNYKKASKK